MARARRCLPRLPGPRRGPAAPEAAGGAGARGERQAALAGQGLGEDGGADLSAARAAVESCWAKEEDAAGAHPLEARQPRGMKGKSLFA